MSEILSQDISAEKSWLAEVQLPAGEYGLVVRAEGISLSLNNRL
jgi:hypothetical protein